MAFNGPGVKEPAKLAIPKKEFNARYILPVENDFFRMSVKLNV